MTYWLGRLLGALRPSRPPHDSGGLDGTLREVHRALTAIRFQPRASLGPEILTRARRGELPSATPSAPRRRLAWGITGMALLAASAWLASGVLPSRDQRVSLDRCCFDLDGAGPPDDGLLISAREGERVDRVVVYEDADRSGSFTPGDPVRLAPGQTPATGDGGSPAVVALNHCCWDLDAGDGEDDGVMIVTAPPDRVLLAAIYDNRRGADARLASLRYVLR